MTESSGIRRLRVSASGAQKAPPKRGLCLCLAVLRAGLLLPALLSALTGLLVLLAGLLLTALLATLPGLLILLIGLLAALIVLILLVFLTHSLTPRCGTTPDNRGVSLTFPISSLRFRPAPSLMRINAFHLGEGRWNVGPKDMLSPKLERQNLSI